ncbi:MAG TPA: DNA methyltransferase [Candidatus Saccharimonadales bacterium]|nr:DNA methyltransferase [Candidatus Saccharimonadales bacterium]
MGDFEAKSLCILGRQPKLGLAELESLYGAEHIVPLGGVALLDIPAEEINFKRLGGTIKIAQILARLPYYDWKQLTNYLQDNIPKNLKHLEKGKFTLGLSLYGLKVSVPELNRSMLQIKRVIKASGRSVRIVPNKTLPLSSAQVLHNKLTHKGAWELLFVADGPRTILAQTLFVQDIEAYAARDQARPARDARVGMLPPKLAQIIINLAMGMREIEQPNTEPSRYLVLDPFCGTGVVLQEALLMGYRVVGTDIDPRMVDYAIRNLKWLYQKNPEVQGSMYVEEADATSYQWQMFSTIASEVYLGRPLSPLPSPEKLNGIISDVNTIVKKFLQNLQPQLRDSQKLCLALPAWQISTGKFKRLPVVDKLTDMGYDIKKFKHVSGDDLIYYRENQIVARQLIVLEKKQ